MEMEVHLVWVEGWAVEVSEALIAAIQLKMMQQKVMELESRSRRNNILIFGETFCCTLCVGAFKA